MRKGQASVELILAIPLLFCLLFLIVELAFFFGGTSYANYAAFSGARAQQVGQDPEEATALLLDGNITELATVSAGGSDVTIEQPWPMDLPFVHIFGDFDFEVTVVAGPDEADYEGLSGPLSSMYGDNQCN